MIFTSVQGRGGLALALSAALMVDVAVMIVDVIPVSLIEQ